jgi:hypothetical protein
MQLLETNNPMKDAEDVTAGEESLQGVAETAGDAASTSLEGKKRGFSVRLFGTNSLKKGAV